MILLILSSELSASDIVNPPKAFEDVFKEGQEGHDLYIVSHHDYFAGKTRCEVRLRIRDPQIYHEKDIACL